MATYKTFAISSGHGKYIRGASGYLDEVNEARRVVDRVAELLRGAGVAVKTFHDDVSHSQSENLNRITNWHNSQSRELDVSVHFNAYQTTSKPMGTECLYVTQEELSRRRGERHRGRGRIPEPRTEVSWRPGLPEQHVEARHLSRDVLRG